MTPLDLLLIAGIAFTFGIAVGVVLSRTCRFADVDRLARQHRRNQQQRTHR